MPLRDSIPLPEEPALASVAAALQEAGHWADIVDRQWRLVFSTDDKLRITGGLTTLATAALGEHFFGPAAFDASLQWRSGPNNLQQQREMFAALGPHVLADTPGGREELRSIVHPALADLVDGFAPIPASPAATFLGHGIHVGEPVPYFTTTMRIHDATGRLAGTALIMKPAAAMAVIATVAVGIDARHFERMQHVAKAARRPAAILFADLEASSPLARRLPSASYFALGRRLARAADRCIIDAGGLVGRHVGDGVVAFFLADTAGSESAAAHACIMAARTLRSALAEVAAHSNLPASDVVMRFGLHWGSTLYVGQIATTGRTEVTALGDEVNETARIEACASGGRALASKSLVERLGSREAADLGLDLKRIAYIPLGELATATEKARRDAPAIAVCEI